MLSAQALESTSKITSTFLVVSFLLSNQCSKAYNGVDSRLRVVLVSVGIGSIYEKSIHDLEKIAGLIGFDSTRLYTESDLNRDLYFHAQIKKLEPLNRHPSRFCTLYQQYCRPFCMAIKAVALLRAMETLPDSSYVMWTDASRHIDYSNVNFTDANIHDAIAQLQNSHVRSMYGLVECADFNPTCERRLCLENGDGNLIDRETIEGFSNMIPDVTHFLHYQHILTANIVLENTHDNRVLVRSWLKMALSNPAAFCASSWTQDQAAWSILVANWSLPLINPCRHHRAHSRLSCKNDVKKSSRAHEEIKNLIYVIRLMSGNLYQEDSFAPKMGHKN